MLTNNNMDNIKLLNSIDMRVQRGDMLEIELQDGINGLLTVYLNLNGITRARAVVEEHGEFHFNDHRTTQRPIIYTVERGDAGEGCSVKGLFSTRDFALQRVRALIDEDTLSQPYTQVNEDEWVDRHKVTHIRIGEYYVT